MTDTTETVHYWTYSIDGGEYFDHEFTSQKKAADYAQVRFNEDCSDGDDYKIDQEADIELIRYHFDDDGERIIHETVQDTVEYEYYHGDLAEHGTWYKGGGGVL